jgi:uncharacterized protein YjbI with pentapeptide repeats
MKSPELEKILEDHSLWVITSGKEGNRLDLSGANLSHANLSEAKMFCADLTRVELTGADMSQADLRRADLTGARLPRETDQAPCNPAGRTSLEKILEDHSLWVRTDGAEGTRLDLSGADLTEADLSEAALSGAYLSEVDLTGANLFGAIFVNAYAPRADFSGAYMRAVNLSGADLTGARKPRKTGGKPSTKTINSHGGEQAPGNQGGPSALQGD